REDVGRLIGISVIIKKSETDPRGNTYPALSISPDSEEEVRKAIAANLHSLFTKEITAEKLSDVVQRNIKGAIRLYERLMDSKETVTVTLFVGRADPETETIGKELTSKGLAYVVGYRSANW